MKVIVSGDITVPLEELQEVNQALSTHIALTRQEPGCLVFEVEQDIEVPGRFGVYEEFVDQEAFDYHQERTSKSAWAAKTRNVIRNYAISVGPCSSGSRR